jgi:adhesin transport system outer membrane protein
MARRCRLVPPSAEHSPSDKFMDRSHTAPACAALVALLFTASATAQTTLPVEPAQPASTAASAQPATRQDGGMTLQQVVAQTLLGNPEVKARYNDFKASLEGQNAARGGFLPQLNARAYLGREWRSNLPGQGSASWNRPGYNLELRQLLFDGFRTSSDYEQAGFEKLSRYYDLLATSDDVALQAAQAYLDVRRYRALEALARENYALHEQTLEQLRTRADSGVGRRVDHVQASGRLALAQTNLMTASANLNDVLQRFQRITGLGAPADLPEPPQVQDRLPASPGNFNPSLRLNPGLLAKQALLQAADAGSRSARGALAPKFELVGSTGTDTSQPGPEYRNVRGSNVQFVMSYNLYRGGADSARIRQSAAQAYAARDVRDYTCRNLQQDLAIAFNNDAHLRRALPFLRDHEAATAKVREAYRQQFQIGQRSLLDLLDTENELFESRRALVNATYDLQLAQYRWLALSHQLLPTLGLLPALQDAPQEARKLQIGDDVIKLCNSTVPDAARLEPVRVHYSAGTLPPTLLPATAAPADDRSRAVLP